MTDTQNNDIERLRAMVNGTLASHEATIRFAEIAMRSLLILAGGGAIALLSFASNRWAVAPAALGSYAWSILLCGLAAAGAVVVAGFSYFAQSFYTEASEENAKERIGDIFRSLAVITFVASLLAFIGGVWTASDAVSRLYAARSATACPQATTADRPPSAH